MSDVVREITGWVGLLRIWFIRDKRLEIVSERGMSCSRIDLPEDWIVSFFSFGVFSVAIEDSCPIGFLLDFSCVGLFQVRLGRDWDLNWVI